MDEYMGQIKDVTLGQDFLTWLWYKSESTAGHFQDRKGRDFELFMEQRIQVQGGEGESLETATVSGALSELREARLGLATGKKVSRALARIQRDADTWQVSLKAEDFSANSLKTPKIDTHSHEDGDDPDAVFLEKVYLIEECFALLDSLYAHFLGLRLGSRWEDEVRAMRVWLEKTSR